MLQAFQGPTAAPLGGDFSNAVVATFGRWIGPRPQIRNAPSSPPATTADTSSMGKRQKKTDPRRAAAQRKRPVLVGFACAVWLASTAALFGVLFVLAPRFVPAFESLQVDLPQLTQWTAAAGRAMHTGIGWAAAAGFLFVGLLPVLLGARSARTAKLYLAAALMLLLFAGLAYFAVEHPAARLLEHLRDSPAAPAGNH